MDPGEPVADRVVGEGRCVDRIPGCGHRLAGQAVEVVVGEAAGDPVVLRDPGPPTARVQTVGVGLNHLALGRSRLEGDQAAKVVVDVGRRHAVGVGHRFQDAGLVVGVRVASTARITRPPASSSSSCCGAGAGSGTLTHRPTSNNRPSMDRGRSSPSHRYT